MSTYSTASQLAQQTERRSERVWAEDGLPDLFLGTFLLMAALAVGLRQALWWLSLTLVVLPPVAVWLLGKVMIAVKARLSDPRSGYLRPRPWRPSRRLIVSLLVLGAVLGGTRGALAEHLAGAIPALPAWGPLFFLVPAIVAIFVGWHRLRLVRHLWVAMVSLLGLAVGPLFGLHGWGSFGLACGIQGAALVVAGGIALRNFVRRAPLPRA